MMTLTVARKDIRAARLHLRQCAADAAYARAIAPEAYPDSAEHAAYLDAVDAYRAARAALYAL